MEIEKYLELLIKEAKKHPKSEVFYSSDDEGNSFSRVHFAPKYDEFHLPDNTKVKGICIN